MLDDLPEYVYKYFKIDEHFLNVLRNQELWFSSPEDFNDPFDCKLYSPSTYSSDDVDLLLNTLFPDQEIQKKFLEANAVKDKHILRLQLFEVFQKMINQRGVCCFSEDYQNLLMWAHYSNCHKGVCVRFNTLKLRETFANMFKVVYCGKFPEIDLFYDFKEALSTAAFHKSTHWAYEKEIRIQTNEKGLHPFKIDAIDEIIFGIKCKDAMYDVVKATKSKGYDHIKFRSGQISPYEYSIYFNQFNNFKW